MTKPNYNDKYEMYYLRIALIATTVFLSAQGALNKNLIKTLTGPLVSQLVYVVFIAISLYVAYDREFYLPFLGDSVFPNGLLVPNVTPIHADTAVEVKVPPSTKVIYWAAEPCNEKSSNLMAWDAYGEYTNSGVSTANEDGIALLSVRGPPSSYFVPHKETKLKSHIHYRYQVGKGMLSKIFTV